ncbi:MAG: hypothetical protein MMC33_002820 [Icmadophila ericetorum]|nr:hypothetical protein [Icmadophila ericetorum]
MTPKRNASTPHPSAASTAQTFSTSTSTPPPPATSSRPVTNPPKSSPAPQTSYQSTSSTSSSSTTTTTTKSSSSAKSSNSQSPSYSGLDIEEILTRAWDHYNKTTPQRVKLMDVFMTFLVAVGVLQFLYCVVGGNYPFNAFLSGFSATVGQFVLTASLRIQTNPDNKFHFKSISQERAFADFVLGSLILHFFCVNFIN